jgi:hypothetical protein
MTTDAGRERCRSNRAGGMARSAQGAEALAHHAGDESFGLKGFAESPR